MTGWKTWLGTGSILTLNILNNHQQHHKSYVIALKVYNYIHTYVLYISPVNKKYKNQCEVNK